VFEKTAARGASRMGWGVNKRSVTQEGGGTGITKEGRGVGGKGEKRGRSSEVQKLGQNPHLGTVSWCQKKSWGKCRREDLGDKKRKKATVN